MQHYTGGLLAWQLLCKECCVWLVTQVVEDGGGGGVLVCGLSYCQALVPVCQAFLHICQAWLHICQALLHICTVCCVGMSPSVSMLLTWA